MLSSIAAVFCVFGILLTGYILYLGLPTERLQKIHDAEYEKPINNAVELQEGSLVRAHELNSYLVFAERKKPVAELIKIFESEGKLSSDKNSLKILSDFRIAVLARNHCSQIYCLQYKIPFKYIPSLFW